MIDMDYEKKYNEALKDMRAIYPNLKGDAKLAVEHAFPELAESEDERIRKAIINYILYETKGNISEATEHVWVTWLEKQKYDRMKPIYDAKESFESALEKAWNDYHNGYENVDKLEDDYVECAHAKGFREGFLYGLEKQKENPKSAISIPADCTSDAKCEDKSPKHSDSDGTDIRDTPAYWKGWDDAMKQKEQKHPNGCFTCDEYKKGYEAGRLNGFTAGYNKAMKEVDQKEQKPWKVGANAYFTPEQKPAEWSEEEEEMLHEADIAVVGYYRHSPKYFPKDKCEHIRSWLKSLRPQGSKDSLQSHWKPSKEQMTNLLRAEGRLRIEGESVLASKLAELYEQLKKLI